jgi:hypothetical protein
MFGRIGRLASLSMFLAGLSAMFGIADAAKLVAKRVTEPACDGARGNHCSTYTNRKNAAEHLVYTRPGYGHTCRIPRCRVDAAGRDVPNGHTFTIDIGAYQKLGTPCPADPNAFSCAWGYVVQP